MIELKYIAKEGSSAVLLDREKYDEFTERIRRGEIIDEDSEEYKVWKRLDTEYRRRSKSTIYHVLGFIPSKPWRFHTLFTSIFVHGGVLHFLGNMWFLWLLGCNIEDVWGRRNFLVFFLGAGIVAVFLHSLINFGSDIPCIGASGAISGVMAAYMFLFPRSKILSFVPVFFLPLLIPIPAFIFVAIWFIGQLYSGTYHLLFSPTATGIAFWAHIGGFLGGLILYKFFLSPKRKRKKFRYKNS